MGAMIFPVAEAILDLQNIANSHTGGEWNFHLYTNNFTPNNRTVLADFVEPVYAGYAPQPIAAAPASEGIDGTIYMEIYGVFFQMTNDAIPTTVWGFFLTDITTGALCGSGLFDDGPVALSNDQIAFGPYGRYSFVPPGTIETTI